MKTDEIRKHLIGPIDQKVFALFGWHCKRCQITLFNLLSDLFQ